MPTSSAAPLNALPGRFTGGFRLADEGVPGLAARSGGVQQHTRLLPAGNTLRKQDWVRPPDSIAKAATDHRDPLFLKVGDRGTLGGGSRHTGEGHHVLPLDHLPDEAEVPGGIVGVVDLDANQVSGKAAVLVDHLGPDIDGLLHDPYLFPRGPDVLPTLPMKMTLLMERSSSLFS